MEYERACGEIIENQRIKWNWDKIVKSASDVQLCLEV